MARPAAAATACTAWISTFTRTYVVFGATFNNLFLVHIVLLALAIWALICLLASVDCRGGPCR
jgi:hypothetical protein